MESKAPELTVCIPVLNNEAGCKELISDFYRFYDPSMFRIIVVDQTKNGIQFEAGKVHLHIRAYRNLGFAKAQNTAWKLVQTPYTLLANDDVRLLHPRWYEDAKAYLKNKEVLAVNPFPAIRTWDGAGNVVWYWDDFNRDGTRDDRFDFVKNKPFEQYTEDDYNKLVAIHTKEGREKASLGTVMFFTLLRTEARDIVGLLEEEFGVGNGEDYSFNRRIFLTCVKCNKRKYKHFFEDKMPEGQKYLCPKLHVDDNGKHLGDSWFEPYKIFTIKDSLVHHQCGVTKSRVEEQGIITTYETLENAKNIFNTKWRKEGEVNEKGEQIEPGIYGYDGVYKPHGDWFTELPL